MELRDLSPRAIYVLRELARRRPALTKQQREAASNMAATLRAFMYPKQAAFFRSKARWRATSKTRRAGATAGGCRELLARAITQPGFRATYAATTRDEARSRAWKSDTKSGLVDLLEQYGTQVPHPTLTSYDLGGVRVDVRDVDSRLEFSNGSQVELFGADGEKGQRRKRGGAKHVFWIDEAQDFTSLDRFIDAVALAAMSDFGGELWVSGTPGRDCTGMFYDITKDPADGEDPLPNWEVHVISVVDNPKFGRVVDGFTDDGVPTWYVVDNLGTRHGHYETFAEAEKDAVQVRWDRTAGEALQLKGWTGTEPDFIREWLGKWVKEDARYVYPIHVIPEHQLLYAPQRLAPNPFIGTHDRFAKHPQWYDHHAAVADLPRPKFGRRAYQWLFALGVDFGYKPDPFALVLWAFNMELPDVYEMFSWKMTEVNTDDQGAYMKLLWDAVDGIVSFVGDPAGKTDDFAVWQTRMGLPIDPANKRGKETLEEFLADDVRRGRIHLRRGSPLHLEMKHLVYLPAKPGKPRVVHKHRKVNGVEYGDHCCDGARYSYTDLTHFLSKERTEAPKPGTPEAMAREEAKHETALEREDRIAEQLAAGDEAVAEYETYQGYQW